ncbi:MAG: hypothetical protein GXO27_00825 [Chlorobi bacterium]|nr:hypothetical protein [Chlorobiota bacterium]
MKLPVNALTGAVIGDIAGSVYEFFPVKHKDVPLFDPDADFTDDTVMTVAVADAIMNGKDFTDTLRDYGRRYPGRGYGSRFSIWLSTPVPMPYGSYGNGSAMRVSPAGEWARTLDEALDLARRSAEITHNHPEGIRGAQATAAAVWLAKHGASKDEIRRQITDRFRYNLDFTIDELRPQYRFHETCQRTVPPAIVAFLDSHDFEDAVRLAISLGGDADTLAAIAGSMAAAYYKHIPEFMLEEAARRLPDEFIRILQEFEARKPAR